VHCFGVIARLPCAAVAAGFASIPPAIDSDVGVAGSAEGAADDDGGARLALAKVAPSDPVVTVLANIGNVSAAGTENSGDSCGSVD
jgi:hypothetical protein